MNRQRQLALPLVLPNGCTWDEKSKSYNKTSVQRKSLYVIPKALDQLREIKGPVCVVSVAGPQRKGKSYILSKAFDQGEVFPLGHSMTPETFGIWLWVVPQKFKDSTGRDFTVVLLDCEGSDSPSAKQEDDYGIFTLSVLLSSILIYNSVGVANRSDLESLDFIEKLSKRIQLYAKKNSAIEKEESHFHETFPKFIWLLRDVSLELPGDCFTTRDYFIKKVLNARGEAASSEQALKAADSILNFFSEFDAFSLESPAYNPKVMRNLNDKSLESKVNPEFLEGIKEFKKMLYLKLAPKRSIRIEEYVTGEALASMVELFVKALNTPGVVPNVENAWDSFVRKKCSDVLDAAVNIYKEEMTSRVKNEIPCNTDVLRKAHEESVDVGQETFRRETFALSAKNVEEYLTGLRNKTKTILEDWIQENKRRTEVHCNDLFKNLKEEILKPVLHRLSGPEVAKMEFQDLVKAYEKLEEKYKSTARGAKEVQSFVFMNLISELEVEKKQHRQVLQRMKDYSADVEHEKKMKIIAEERQARFEEIIAGLKEECKTLGKQVKVMQEKQKKDMERIQSLKKTAKGHKIQIKNLKEANFKEREREREQIFRQQPTLEELQQQIANASARIIKEKKDKEMEIEESSKPGFMDIIAPLAIPVIGLVAAALPKPCSIM